MARERKYADLVDPLVAAAAEGRLTYPSLSDAIYQFEQIEKKFVLSREHKPNIDHAFVLWIRGYDISSEELKAGFRGNFALLQATKLMDGSYGILCEKVKAPLETHPEKKRENKDTPNWLHPVLRAIKKGKRYDSFDEAYGEFLILQKDFPKVAIPGRDSLQIMIYEREKGEKGGVKKYNFKITHRTEDGKWQIKTQSKPVKVVRTSGRPTGNFTSRIAPRKKL